MNERFDWVRTFACGTRTTDLDPKQTAKLGQAVTRGDQICERVRTRRTVTIRG